MPDRCDNVLEGQWEARNCFGGIAVRIGCCGFQFDEWSERRWTRGGSALTLEENTEVDCSSPVRYRHMATGLMGSRETMRLAFRAPRTGRSCVHHTVPLDSRSGIGD